MGSPWFVEAFGATYLDVYAHRDEAAARVEVAFAAHALRLSPTSRVLDAGCGAGRHARALAASGARVVGLDLSADLLARAVAEGGGPSYVRGDLRALPFRDAGFDAVASFFTAFGYFEDAGNRQQLREQRRVLAPGGRLALDFLNAHHVVAHLVAESVRERAGATIHEERRIRAGRVEKDVHVVRDDAEVVSWTESVRLYTADELADLLGDAGLRCLSRHGDLAGAAFDAQRSPRCVLVAEAS